MRVQERAMTTPTEDEAQIVAVLRAIFVAARDADEAGFAALIAPGYYMYDGGKRFDGTAIMGLIKAAYAEGRRFDWNVTEPDVHVAGDTAWVAYVNRGGITDASGTKPQSWLESACFTRIGGAWKIAFLHSTRAAA
jgi:ketosteroid isomerase-like protein